MSKTETRTCPHGDLLTRIEAAEHMACTPYGRVVDPRTVDRWANEKRIARIKGVGLQWVRFHRAELDRLADTEQANQPRG